MDSGNDAMNSVRAMWSSHFNAHSPPKPLETALLARRQRGAWPFGHLLRSFFLEWPFEGGQQSTQNRNLFRLQLRARKHAPHARRKSLR